MQPSHGGGVTIAPVTVAPTVISTARTEPSAGSAASSAERTSTSGDNSAPQISVVTLPSGVALPAGTVTVTVAPGTLPSYQQAAQLLASQTPANMTGAIVAQPLPLLDGQSVVSLAPIQKVEDNSECVFEADKRAIYRHPLFPLLNLLFEKCEQASHTTDCPSADSFNVDIQQFVHQQEREQKPFFSDDPNLDSLMVKAIQVLRIHLLELEKVTDLCKDFCTRYITCLKGKLQSENLLRIEGSEFDLSPPTTPTPLTPTSTPQVVSAVGGGGVLIQSGGIQQAALPLPTLSQGQLVSGGTVYQMVQTPQGIVAQPVQIQTSAIQTAIPQGSLIHGSTPLSQIGMVAPVTQATTPTGTVASPFVLSATPTSPSDDDDRYGDKKSKRGVLPKSATQVMKSWLFQHIIHPYPTEDEKRQIAAQTNLTLLQVNNWFINARRRILQPMLDSSNPDPSKTKKSRPPSRPVQRFWPDKIANLQPQLSTSGELSDTEADCVQQEVPNEAAVGQSELSNSPDTDMAQQILIQPGPLFSTDGQVVQTGTATVSLAGLQGAQLTTVLGQGGRLLLQNGTVAAQVPEITLKKDS